MCLGEGGGVVVDFAWLGKGTFQSDSGWEGEVVWWSIRCNELRDNSIGDGNEQCFNRQSIPTFLYISSVYITPK